jgi:hypothetical protein
MGTAVAVRRPEDVMPRFGRLRGIALALGLLSGACATSRVPAAHERSAQVRLLDGRPLTSRRSIREVQTFACTRDAASELDLVAARYELRIEAARLGGDVVGNIACHEQDARHHPDCWRVGRCTGDVFRTR